MADPCWPAGWPTTQELQSAHKVVASALASTPLVSVLLDDKSGRRVHLKLETVQPTGSFKVRGALAATAAYATAPGGIVTASAGNHGLGVAWAASRLAVRATIVVPSTASPAKIEALRSFPAKLIVRGKDYDEAEEYARILAAEKGVFVSAYNDRHVIAGQSSMLIEILQHINSDFTMVAPVGGGGLISGLALAACSASQEIKVIGVESAASMAVSATVRAKRLVRVHVSQTIADGLAGNLGPYSMTPDIISFAGTELRSVTENEIYRAMRELANLGVYAEGSAAVGLAAVLNGAVSSEKPIIVAITGRNITVESFTKAFVGA